MECKDCKFCEIEDEVYFMCRRYAPKITAGMCAMLGTQFHEDAVVNEWSDSAVWPIVFSTDWCGEFQTKGTPSPEILDKGIASLELSTRLNNALRYHKVNTVRDLAEKTDSEIKKMRHIGIVSFREIVTKLADAGLYLNYAKK